MSGFTESRCNSSGCESGWTMYFQESYETEDLVEDEEEGDLSMISDASSGPRNNGFYNQENCQSARRSLGKSTAKTNRKQDMGRRDQQYSSCLHDTASSPVFGLSKRETNPYTKEGFVENVKEASKSHSRKQHGKKQASFFRSSSPTKLDKNVTDDFQEAKWEQ